MFAWLILVWEPGEWLLNHEVWLVTLTAYIEQLGLLENTWNSTSAVWLNLHQGTATYSLKTFAECFFSTAESYLLFIFCCFAPDVCSGSKVKTLEIYIYYLLGFLLCEDLFFRHMDTSAFIKSICKCLQGLNCGVFLSPPADQHFKVIFLFLLKTCLSAYL